MRNLDLKRLVFFNLCFLRKTFDNLNFLMIHRLIVGMKHFFKPDKVFLIDGIGAAISAILLLLLIAPFESFFGFPAFAAINLALLPVIFSIYSLSCYWSKPKSAIYLKIIAVANIFYCLLSLGLMIHYFHQLTLFGLLYFLIEKLIVLPLAMWEWKIASIQSR